MLKDNKRVGKTGRGIGREQALLQVRNLQRRFKMDRVGLGSFLQVVADGLGPEGGAATLVLVGDDRMRVLNRMFRGYDRPTDVLAFASDKSEDPEDQSYLGDIVISAETANRQALRRGSNLDRELKVLALHGFLHLLGYDHESADGKMRRIEYRWRRKLGITSPGKKGPGRATAARRKK